MYENIRVHLKYLLSHNEIIHNEMFVENGIFLEIENIESNIEFSYSELLQLTNVKELDSNKVFYITFEILIEEDQHTIFNIKSGYKSNLYFDPRTVVIEDKSINIKSINVDLK